MSDININPNDLRCAPSRQFENGSCIPLYLLVEMAKAYNDFYSGDSQKKPIKLSSNLELLKPDKYKQYLVKEFKNRLSDVCENQQCWLKQEFVSRLKKELKFNIFRPKGPQGAFTWLNTSNIERVMSQYHEKYKNFMFMGAVPIDFDDLPIYNIKNLNYDQLISDEKHKLGFIFNLDEHYKSGSHWVSLYTDLKKGQIYFFDSYGIQPENRIAILMRRIADYLKTKGIKPTLDYNKLRHQYKSSNCGDYSMAFILRMARGDPFEDINNNRVSDESIAKCRKYYFSI